MSKIVWIKKPEKRSRFDRRWWCAFLAWIAFICILAVVAARVSRG